MNTHYPIFCPCWCSFLRKTVILVGLQLLWLSVDVGAETVLINRPGKGVRTELLDFHGGFTHFGAGPALGVRYSIPIVHNGFVPTINNTVSVSFGGDFYWVKIDSDEYATALGFPVTLQWRFLFTSRWSAFGELGVNLFLAPDLIAGEDWRWHPGSWVIAAIGGRLRLNRSWSLVGRLGNPYSSIGASLRF